MNGRTDRLDIDGCHRIWEGVVQFPQAEKNWSIWPFNGREDHIGPIHDYTRRDGRCRRENQPRSPTNRGRACTPEGHTEKGEMAWGEASGSFSRLRRRTEVLESLDRRHGRKTGGDSRVHGRPQREGWEQRRYYRRSGRSGLSRRFLNREKMEI